MTAASTIENAPLFIAYLLFSSEFSAYHGSGVAALICISRGRIDTNWRLAHLALMRMLKALEEKGSDPFSSFSSIMEAILETHIPGRA